MKATVGRSESTGFRLGVYVLVVLGALPVLLPTYWMVLASLKSRERISVSPPDWLPLDVHNRITIAGQEVDVVIFDDARVSGTGVPRVKMKHDAELLLPQSAISRHDLIEYAARIDGVERRVIPLSPAEHDDVRVALPGTRQQLTVPASRIITREQERTYWSLLGEEIAVELLEGEAASEIGEARIRLAAASPTIRVAPHLIEPGDPATVAWRQRRVAVGVEAAGGVAGFAAVRPMIPAGGLQVPSRELRVERRVRQFVLIDGEEHEVKSMAAGSDVEAVVELLGQPRQLVLPSSELIRRTRTVCSAEILGRERPVEPLRDDVADGSAANVAVFVPGPIAVAASQLHGSRRVAPQWRNFVAAWREQDFDLYIANTLFVASLVVLGTIVSCGLVGYGFARLEFRGRDVLFVVLLATMMVPAQVTAIPTFVLFVKFGWIDTYAPLIVPHFLASSAFFVFLFRQFMLTIPNELEDAARIDGCGPLATWWLVMMPLSKPIIITVAVFSFTYVWNDFLAPLLYINSDEKQTVALGLQSFKSAFQAAEPQLIMAASVMMIIPTVVLFFLAQKAFMRGVVVSGVKG
jgi:ABC-type glycerol-3-phosphate transport system permease component